MNKIFTFGDGFATGHLWPEWPQILQALLPDYEIINFAAIGAGAEWLVTQFTTQIPVMRDEIVIFQWPQANRFDKLIEDEHWRDIARNDPSYSFNLIVDDDNRSWWISSASKSAEIVNYHNTYIQHRQHILRLNTYKTLIGHTLQNINCKYFFTSTSDEDIFSHNVRFSTVRQTQIQPSPPIHLVFLIEQVLPNLGSIKIDQTRLLKLTDKICNNNWIPYDPLHKDVWDDIIKYVNED